MVAGKKFANLKARFPSRAWGKLPITRNMVLKIGIGPSSQQ